MSDWASDVKAYTEEDGMPKEPEIELSGIPEVNVLLGGLRLRGKSFLSMASGGLIGFNPGAFDHLMDSLAMTMRPLKVRTDHKARANLMVYDEYAQLDDFTVTKESWVEKRGLNKNKVLKPKNNPKGNAVYGTTWRHN